MRRREFIKIIVGSASAWPLAVLAQQSGKVLRIGMLATISAEFDAANLSAFRNSLRNLGYAEGETLLSNIGRPTVVPSALLN